MRALPLLLVSWIAFAVGCKKSQPAAQPQGSAAVTPPAGAPAAAARDQVIARLGAPGGSVYTEELVASDDGGFVLSAEVRGKLDIAGTTIAQANKDEPVDAVIAFDGSGKPRWVRALDAHCSGSFQLATRGTSTVIAGSCSRPVDTPSGRIAPAKDEYDHFFLATLDDRGAITWAKYAGAAGGHQIVHDLAVDADGTIVVAGWLFASADLGTGPINVPAHGKVGFVAAYDADGKARWVQTYPTAFVHAVVVAGDEVSIAGTFSQQLQVGATKLVADQGGRFVARLAKGDGAPRAAIKVGENASMEQELVRAPSGTLYLVADDLAGVALYGIDAAGQAKELHRIAGRDSCLVGNRDLAIDATGTLWLATCFGKPVDFGGGPVTPVGFDDAIVVTYHPDGAYAGAHPLGTERVDTLHGLAIDKTGAPVVAWFSEAGPADKPYRDWLITEVYYAAAIERIAR